MNFTGAQNKISPKPGISPKQTRKKNMLKLPTSFPHMYIQQITCLQKQEITKSVALHRNPALVHKPDDVPRKRLEEQGCHSPQDLFHLWKELAGVFIQLSKTATTSFHCFKPKKPGQVTEESSQDVLRLTQLVNQLLFLNIFHTVHLPVWDKLLKHFSQTPTTSVLYRNYQPQTLSQFCRAAVSQAEISEDCISSMEMT